MRRTIHPLQKAVTAIINTVEHMREVVVIAPSYPITLWCRQNMIVKFTGKNQRGALFLQPEVLTLSIEHCTVALAHHLIGMRKSSANLTHSRVRCNRLFDIKRFDHYECTSGLGLTRGPASEDRP